MCRIPLVDASTVKIPLLSNGMAALAFVVSESNQP